MTLGTPLRETFAGAAFEGASLYWGMNNSPKEDKADNDSDNDPEAQAHEIEELQYNLAQNGGAGSVGLTVSGNEGEGYYIDENGEKKKDKKDKKDKALEELMLTLGLSDIAKEFNDMLNDIKKDIQFLEDCIDRQRRSREAYRNGDADTLREIYVNEHHMEEARNWSSEQVMDYYPEIDKKDDLAIETYKESIKMAIKDAAEEMKNGKLPPKERDLLQDKLDELRNDAKDQGVNFDKEYKEALSEDLENASLYMIGRGESISAQIKTMKLDDEGSKQMAFAQAALGEQPKAEEPQANSPAIKTEEPPVSSATISQDVCGF